MSLHAELKKLAALCEPQAVTITYTLNDPLVYVRSGRTVTDSPIASGATIEIAVRAGLQRMRALTKAREPWQAAIGAAPRVEGAPRAETVIRKLRDSR